MSMGSSMPSHVLAALLWAAEAGSSISASSKINQLHSFIRFSFFICVALSYGSGDPKANFRRLNAGIGKWFGHSSHH